MLDGVTSSIQPLVSILIPAFNAERWVGATVRNALAQTYPRIELIIVDDGSSDATLEILKGIQGPKVKLLSQPHAGPGAARNLAFQNSQGEFIQYLDADDLLHCSKIEAQLARLLRAEHGYVASCAWCRFYGLEPVETFAPAADWRDLSAIEWLILGWGGGGTMPIHTWLTPRRLIEQSGLWDQRLSTADDGEFFARTLLKSRGILFCPEAKAFYRSGLTHSVSQRHDMKGLLSWFNAIDSAKRHVLMAEDSPRTRRAFANAFQYLAFAAYPSARDLSQNAVKMARELGGSDVRPGGGRLFSVFCGLAGWRAARWFQTQFRRIRYPLARKRISMSSAP
jgi:glycosyltransferase involved in cell wall biosynthesis